MVLFSFVLFVFSYLFVLHTPIRTHTHIQQHTQGCSAHFSSLMGYQYHKKRCGGELSDDEKPVFLCHHCGKSYRSKAGRDYHVRTEHSPAITTTTISTNSKNATDRNNNTGKERVRSSRSECLISDVFILFLFLVSVFVLFLLYLLVLTNYFSLLSPGGRGGVFLGRQKRAESA